MKRHFDRHGESERCYHAAKARSDHTAATASPEYNPQLSRVYCKRRRNPELHAIKYKANAQELAIVNNKEVNEVLIVGQRITRVPVK